MAFSDFAVRHSSANNDPAPISVLAPYSNILLTSCLCTMFVIKHYILEPYLPHVYAHIWGLSPDPTKRALLTLHIALLVRVVLLGVALYPFLTLIFGSSKVSDPVGFFLWRVTMGDRIVLAMSILPSYYLFEIIYRSRLSIVTWIHHVGSIFAAQGAVTLVIYGHKNARYLFLLMTTWGFFDVVMELGPTIALIRLRAARGDHDHLYFVFGVTALWVFALNNIQSVLVTYFMWATWDEWVPIFKIGIPALYLAFTASQWQQAYLYRKLMRRELDERFRKIALKEAEGHSLSPQEEEEKEKEN
ncbi:hypothetical protein TWF281_002714 [Arthrobotrys megalospora]